jgi:hypothetical protein
MAEQPAIPEGFEEVQTLEQGPPVSGLPDRGPIGVDDPSQSASFWTTIKASLQPDISKQIEQYATDRGIDIRRYGVDREGNVVFINDKGKVVREIPSVEGATGVVDFLRRLGQNIGAFLGPTAPETVGTAVAMYMPNPLLKVPAGMLAAGATDVARQGLGNILLDRPVMDVDPINAAGHAALTGAGVGVPQLASKLVRRTPFDIAPHEAVAMRDQAQPAEWARRAALAEDAGVDLSPANITGLRSMQHLERQLGRETEGADIVGEAYKRREGVQLPAYMERQLGEISPGYSRGLAQREMGTASQDIIDQAVARRTMAANPHYEEAYASGVTPDIADVIADLSARIERTPVNSKHRKALQRILNMMAPERKIGAGPRAITVRAAETDYRRLHEIKLEIDADLDAIKEGAPAAVRVAGRNLEEIQNSLTAKLRGAHPGYEEGYQKFIAMSEAVDEARKGLVGAAARERAAGFQLTPNKFFAFNSADVESITSTRAQFVRSGKLRQWNRGLRAYIEETADRFAGNEFPSKGFYKIMRDPRAQKNMRAAMTDVQWRAWSDFMEVLGMAANVPVAGSPTATDIQARQRFRKPLGKLISAAAQILSPQDIGNSIKARADLWSEGQGVREMAEIFMKPGAIRELKKLRLMPKGGENALMVVFNLLARYGAFQAMGIPTEFPPPVLAEDAGELR